MNDLAQGFFLGMEVGNSATIRVGQIDVHELAFAFDEVKLVGLIGYRKFVNTNNRKYGHRWYPKEG